MKLDKIHEDHRGSIYSVTEQPLTRPEVSFLSTKAGLMRGGCIHRKNSEHLCVIEGEIKYVYSHNEDGREPIVANLKAGETITIPPNTPHYMLSITNSVIIEWNCEIEEKQEKHATYRKIVLDHNALTNNN